jgi:hypothetical protein
MFYVNALRVQPELKPATSADWTTGVRFPVIEILSLWWPPDEAHPRLFPDKYQWWPMRETACFILPLTCLNAWARWHISCRRIPNAQRMRYGRKSERFWNETVHTNCNLITDAILYLLLLIVRKCMDCDMLNFKFIVSEPLFRHFIVQCRSMQLPFWIP